MKKHEIEERLIAYEALSWYIQGLEDGLTSTDGASQITINDVFEFIGEVIDSLEHRIEKAKEEQE